ncbi:histidine phosphatase family protein [Paenibacillus chitinolyticus]|uniref:histidine phosphatase family protein n=1 Tax=Paenibacillus chitinolyticus TaxID=79263 RepID=UPI001C48B9AD|nr:histidine phosphatase family protein [Paenibacillus chitinolyticus]MBV6712535.1 histidine phosphatase family protein [Paenibacillus chitinolyticus]
MTTIGFIRHGSTHWNKEGRAQGSSDIPLDEDGLNDAEKLAERIESEKWDYVYSSHLLRAKQTADRIGGRSGIPVWSDERIREAGGGEIEGTTEQERIAKWGAGWRELDLGIEKPESVITRGSSFLEEVLSRHKGKRILIVSHGSFIRTMLKHLLPDSEYDGHLTNTSVTTLVLDDRDWTCGLYNCTKHLE